MNLRIAFLICILCLQFIQALVAQPGSLDKSFGNNGIVVTKICPEQDGIQSIAIQSDKKIVCAGFTHKGSNYDIALARYDTIGSLDPDFGTNGIVNTVVGNLNSGGYSLNIQGDGKIVLAGQSGDFSSSNFTLVRYNINGSLDSAFGVNGIVITQFDGWSQILCSVLDTDGNIIAGGYECGSGPIAKNAFALSRYNSDGTLDGTFGVGGKVVTSINNINDVATSMALRKNSKILLAGWSYEGWNPRFALVQYNHDGSLDQTFGAGGKIITSFPFWSEAWALAIQNDEKVLVAGHSFDGECDNFTLVRYNEKGSLDSTFGANGLVVSKIGMGNNSAMALKIQSDGKILAAGHSLNADSKYEFALAQYDSIGGLDRTFGNNGIVNTSISDFSDWAYSMAIQNNGKIILGGVAHYSDSVSLFAIAQYLPGLNTGSIYPEAVRNSISVYPVPVPNRTTLSYTLAEPSMVNISLTDINGKLIKTLIHNQVQETGPHLQDIFLSDSLPSGPYFLITSINRRCYPMKIIKE